MKKFLIILSYPIIPVIALIQVLFLLLLIFLGKNYIESKQRYEILHNEVVDIQHKVDTIKTNKSYSEAQLKDYDLLLKTLIPSQEDYFSIILALEKLSQGSGIEISSYTIDLGTSTKDKLSLELQGVGTLQSMEKFLSDYKYSGQRLISTEAVNYNNADKVISATITFYHGTPPTTGVGNDEISSEDIALLNTIKNKINITVISTSNEDTQYSTKNNPF